MISDSIKIICLDLTNQYTKELADFYDLSYEESRITKIKNAGKQDQDSWHDDPDKGGSMPNFSQALYDDLKEFLRSGKPSYAQDL